MELYTRVAYRHSRQLTLAYSTSFGLSSRLFSKNIQPHIYAIYGLVRIADEVVDTYRGTDAMRLLDELETSTYTALHSGYSTNPIIHAFAQTARAFGITKTLIAPFFASMRMDLRPQDYSPTRYKQYIHGSAEVVGLMCLRVFCGGDEAQYKHLQAGAAALGSAYQKVNFLRDLAADYKELGRLYFPGISFEDFNEEAKQQIIADIRKDFTIALTALKQLPTSSRHATMLSYYYYSELLDKLKMTPAEIIKTTRIRVPSYRKAQLMARTLIRSRVS